MNAAMDHWAFVIAAYAVAVGLTAALLLWAYASMRRAEAAADALKRSDPNPSPSGEGTRA